ncbi:MAG: dTMP kinase [Hyphomicrobium sp.]
MAAVGKFITLEGGEGSGKSTQVRLLAERLRGCGLDVLLTREPGGSPFAETLRTIILDPKTPAHSALSEALLFYAARADHLDKTVRPALLCGRWVICDRFSDSTRVYQCDAGGLSLDAFHALEEIVVKPTSPDVTVILDLPIEIGLQRVESRRNEAPQASATPDAYERRGLDFHQKLREAFAAIAMAEPQRCLLIDASADEQAVADAIWSGITDRLLKEPR